MGGEIKAVPDSSTDANSWGAITIIFFDFDLVGFNSCVIKVPALKAKKGKDGGGKWSVVEYVYVTRAKVGGDTKADPNSLVNVDSIGAVGTGKG